MKRQNTIVKKQASSTIRVMVVDKHALFREGLRLILEEYRDIEIEVVAEASSGEEAIPIARRLSRLDMIFIAIQLPGMGGLEATCRLKRVQKCSKLLIMTEDNEIIWVPHVLQAGVSGYLTKSICLTELYQAIHQLLAGYTYIESTLAHQLAVKNITGQGQTPFDKLLGRELQISLMVSQGISASKIAKALSLSPKTINSYRYHIFEKLSVQNDVELTRLALRYRLISLDRFPLQQQVKKRPVSTK